MASTTLLGLSLTLSPQLLTALRLAPLLGSTMSLTHAYMELVTTTAFLRPAPVNSAITHLVAKSSPVTRTASPTEQVELDSAKDKVVPIWFMNFFNTAVWSVIGFNSIATCSALANVVLFPEGLGDEKKFYVVGLAAAVAHFAFFPGVFRSVEALFKMCIAQANGKEAPKAGKAGEWVTEWVGVHRTRMFTVDSLAWISYAVGTVFLFSK